MSEAMFARSELPGRNDIAFLLDDVVTALRNRGFTRTTAIGQAALTLGISERKAKAILWGEPFAMAAAEYKAVKQRFLAHLDDEAAHLSARAEAARAKRLQMEMDI